MTKRCDRAKAGHVLGAVVASLAAIVGAAGCSSSQGAGGGAGAGGSGGGLGGSGGELPPTQAAPPAAGGAGGTGADASADGADGPVAGTAEIAGCAPIALPPGIALSAVWIGPAGEVWVAGSGGLVGRRTPDAAGGIWSWCRPGPAADLHAIWGAATDEVWAVGDAGTILRWNGAAWTMVTGVGSPPVANVNDVWGDAAAPGQPHTVWIVGAGGVVRSFDGTAWHFADADARYMLNSVWGSPSGVLRVAGQALLPMVAAISGSEAVVLRRNTDGSWTREGVFQEQRGAGTFARISGASDTNIWAVGVKHPSGAAVAFAFAAHFDGVTWSARAGLDAPAGAPESVIIERIYTDVAVSTPDAPAGAWFTDGIGVRAGAVRFDGTTWSSPDPVASGLLGIDVRGAAMWAAGFDGKVVRWTPSGWVVSNPAVPGP